MTRKTVFVGNYARGSPLSSLSHSCAWCGAEIRREQVPGSYASLLCDRCRSRRHAWAQENYRRRMAGLPVITLDEWAAGRGYPPPPLNDKGQPVFLGEQTRAPKSNRR